MVLTHTFYNGAVLSKSFNEAYEIIEKIASNSYQREPNQAAIGCKVAGVHEVDALTSLAAQVSSMSPILKNLTTNSFNNNLTGQ